MQGLGKLKNTLVIVGVLVITFLAVRAIYDYHTGILGKLEKKSLETKELIRLVETWTELDTAISNMKQTITYKDEVALKQTVENCTKNHQINIIKLSPSKEEKNIYILGKIELTITYSSYSSLVNFINDLEQKKINVVNIRIQRSNQAVDQQSVYLGLQAYLPGIGKKK